MLQNIVKKKLLSGYCLRKKFRVYNVMWKLEQVDILISKNQALQIIYLKHHDYVYKTP